MKRENPWYVGVVVPAKDEEQSIARCIQSIRGAHKVLNRFDRLWIVIVADSCTDATVSCAEKALRGDGEVVECRVGSAGAARTIGVSAVLKHFHPVPAKRIWLANTDADTYVPTDWLQRHLEFAEDGDIGVAGIVELAVDSAEAHVINEIFRPTYLVATDGTHLHVHGANLGVRADAYLAVGGWGALALAEDHCLWNRLKSAGWRLRSTTLSRVITSARLHGRAPGGFADTLHRHIANAHA